MKKYYLINIDDYFSSFQFYNCFLPQLHKYFSNFDNSKKILINLAAINKLSPLVIPNLLNTGIILKEFFNEPVDIHIPWNQKLLAYLRDVNFFVINSQYKIFNIDERYTGDIPSDRSVSDICGTLLIPSNMTKDSIYNCYLSKYQAPLVDQLKCENTVNNILFIMAELSHNGSKHSGGSCFVSFQLNRQNKFEFSVSDCGIGYKESLSKKEDQLKFKSIKTPCNISSINRNIDHFISILEAIFFRKNHREQIYGVYSIFNDVLPRNGVLRVHTYNTQVIFTKHNFSRFIDQNPTHKMIENIINDFINSDKKSAQTKYKPLRIMPPKFRGVHIEIEIPLGHR